MPQPKARSAHAQRQAAYRQRCRQARLAELAERSLPASPPIPTMPGSARWNAAIARAQALLESVRAEMDGYHADRSDAWQESERGVSFGERIQALDDLVSELEQFAAG